jgi:ferric-dicitrate binding protein FerR (iron transport regulator)
MSEPETTENKQIRLTALGWLVQLKLGHPSKKLWAEFEAWMARDPRHRATFLLVEREWPTTRERLKRIILRLH